VGSEWLPSEPLAVASFDLGAAPSHLAPPTPLCHGVRLILQDLLCAPTRRAVPRSTSNSPPRAESDGAVRAQGNRPVTLTSRSRHTAIAYVLVIAWLFWIVAGSPPALLSAGRTALAYILRRTQQVHAPVGTAVARQIPPRPKRRAQRGCETLGELPRDAGGARFSAAPTAFGTIRPQHDLRRLTARRDHRPDQADHRTFAASLGVSRNIWFWRHAQGS